MEDCYPSDFFELMRKVIMFDAGMGHVTEKNQPVYKAIVSKLLENIQNKLTQDLMLWESANPKEPEENPTLLYNPSKSRNSHPHYRNPVHRFSVCRRANHQRTGMPTTSRLPTWRMGGR